MSGDKVFDSSEDVDGSCPSVTPKFMSAITMQARAERNAQSKAIWPFWRIPIVIVGKSYTASENMPM
jgi:hypothetical protein